MTTNTVNLPIINFLSKFSLDSIIKNKRVVTIPDNFTVEKTLDMLARNHIRSAPVVNSSNSENSEKILGIVGTIDICYYVLQIAPNPTIMTKRELNNYFMDGYGISHEKIYKIIDKSNMNPVEVFNPSVALVSVVSTCLSRGVHRVLIVEDNSIVSTVSRSDIVRFLYDAIVSASNTENNAFQELFSGVEDKSDLTESKLSELRETLIKFGGLPIKNTIANLSKELVTCNHNDPVLLVLDKLKDGGHKSLPVVDENGKLVSNFSSSEISALVKDAWPSFGEPVLNYKKHTNSLYGGQILPPVYAMLDENIFDVLKKLVGGKKSIHCIWIVDNNLKPIGSISLTDILRFATKWTDTQ